MPDEIEEEGAENGPAQLREALARKDKRIKELEGRLSTFQQAALEGVAHRAGYDPGAGVIKLVLEKYQAQGDLTPETLTPESFTSFAKEYGVEPVQVAATPTPPSSQQQAGQPITDPGQLQQQGAAVPPQLQQAQQAQQQPAPNPLAAATQLNQMQATPQQLLAAAQAAPPPPATLEQQVAQAEAQGRWSDAFALKVGGAPALPDGFGAQQGVVTPDSPLPVHTPPSAQT